MHCNVGMDKSSESVFENTQSGIDWWKEEEVDAKTNCLILKSELAGKRKNIVKINTDLREYYVRLVCA